MKLTRSVDRTRHSADQASLLFDAPGERGQRRNRVLTACGAAVLTVLLCVVVDRLMAAGQFDSAKWTPFLDVAIWREFIVPGLIGTLKVTALSAVLAVVLGILLGLGRLSTHRWLSVPVGGVIEFLRSMPVLLLIFFIFSGPRTIAFAFNREIPDISAFTAVVIALTLFNGAVLAEIFRAGILAVPSGQSEAAYALGLTRSRVMQYILVPQAITAMMPAIVSQLVVLIKDSALGWIVGYEDLLNAGFRQVGANFGNLIPAAIVVAAIYIAINVAVGRVAQWLEQRSRRRLRRVSSNATPDPELAGAIHRV